MVINKEFLVYGDGVFRGRVFAPTYQQAVKDAQRGYSRSTVSSDFERLDFDELTVIQVLSPKAKNLPRFGQSYEQTVRNGTCAYW